MRVVAAIALALTVAHGSYALEVLSLCGTGKCTMAIGVYDSPLCVMGNEDECGCVVSERGTPCAECNDGAGYLTLDADGVSICTCYARDLDPNAIDAPCSRVVDVTDVLEHQTGDGLVHMPLLSRPGLLHPLQPNAQVRTTGHVSVQPLSV